MSLNITTENAAVARKIFSMVKGLFNLRTEVLVQRKTRLRKNNIYLVRIPPQQQLAVVLRQVGMLDQQDRLKDTVREDLFAKGCCRRAYLRGVFLGGGSVNNPEGTYHLEVTTGNEKHAGSICRLMQKFRLRAKISERKNWQVIYLKGSEQIVRFLNIIGAHSALLSFENARIYKDVRNRVNRLVNCETANLNKTINASVRQIENIRLVRDTIGFDHISTSLREAAELRVKYPDASLKELGDYMQPRLGKSGMSHRLRKIDEIAEKIRSGRR